MVEVVADVPQSTAVDENSSNSEKIESDDATAVPETLPSEKETNGASKRMREEGEENEDEITKKPKVDDESNKEAEVEMKETQEEGKKPESAKLGPMEFESGEAMFNYFFKFLHYWPPNLNVNKYEHLVLLELLKKGQAEPNKKIGEGIQAFQVRYHPMWKSRCFFLVRVDGTSDDFSFRKCVDHILPLPENMKIPSDGNKSFNGKSGGHHNGGSRGGCGGRGGRGHGRRGGFRK